MDLAYEDTGTCSQQLRYEGSRCQREKILLVAKSHLCFLILQLLKKASCEIREPNIHLPSLESSFFVALAICELEVVRSS